METIPTSGISPDADRCSLDIQCLYEENMQLAYEGTKWWQSEGNDPLFFFQGSAIDIQEFIDNKDDSTSKRFTNMINDQSDDLIPVKFYTEGVFKNQIPGQFNLLIKYNQLDVNTKKIVTASVTASNYKQKEPTTNGYKLVVTFEPMGYMDLINTFQFDTPIYLVLFIGLGLVTVIGILVIWLFNKFISRIENPPKLRLNQTFIVAFIPPIIGSLIATIPVVFYLYVFINLLTQSLFDQIQFSYDDEEITEIIQIQFKKGRTGLLILISGIFLIKFGAELLVVEPTDEELKRVSQQQEKKQDGNNLDNNEQDELEKDDKQVVQRMQSLVKNEEECDEAKIIEFLNYKNSHFQTIAVFTSIFLLTLLGFSYMKLFGRYINYFLILL